jgi:hypothetical protein
MVESSTLGAGAILALALLGIVNYFAWKYHARFDWTRSRLYTLSEKSLSVLGSLDKEIDAVVFMTPATSSSIRFASSSPDTKRPRRASTCGRSTPRRTRPRHRAWSTSTRSPG